MKFTSYLAYGFIILFAIGMLYGQFLDNPIVFDDYIHFTEIDDKGRLHVTDYHFSPLEYRSLAYSSLKFTSDIFGPDILHFRVENFLLHAAVSFALFIFLKQLFEFIYGQRADFRLSCGALAFSAALLFALHPVAIYGPGYLVQRTIVMTTLFSILTMSAYLYGSTRDHPMWLWACVPLYYLAMLSKEHAVLLPAVLVALTVLLHEDWWIKLRKRWLIFIAMGVIGLFVVASKRWLLGTPYEVFTTDMVEHQNQSAYLLSIVTQSWLYFKYISMWLFPNPSWMSVDMHEPFAKSIWSGYLMAFVGFIVWGISAFCLLLKRGRMGLVGLAMMYSWLMFMTELSTVRFHENFVLYRSYLWMPIAFCVLPVFLDLLDKRLATVIVTATAIAMFPISMERLITFSHPVLLWDDAEKLVKDRQDLPGVFRIYYNRGTELVDVKKYDQAITDLTISASLNPDWPYAYGNLGVAYAWKKNWSATVA
ncbi:MAG: hypothetical protein R8M11_08735, partial [Gallionella sp.]